MKTFCSNPYKNYKKNKSVFFMMKIYMLNAKNQGTP
jgi:hypothetical protein